MDLFIKDNDKKFILKLYQFIQEVLAKNYTVKYSEDKECIYIGYKYFYIYFLLDDNIEGLCEEYNIDANICIMINIYNKVYEQALNEIKRIIEWLLKRNQNDIMLLDEQSLQVFCRKQGEITINNYCWYFN